MTTQRLFELIALAGFAVAIVSLFMAIFVLGWFEDARHGLRAKFKSSAPSQYEVRSLRRWNARIGWTSLALSGVIGIALSPFQEPQSDTLIVPVRSSFIRKVLYDRPRQTLFMTIGDMVYSYCDVPKDVVEGLAQAPSAGSYYDYAIKGRFKNCLRQPADLRDLEPPPPEDSVLDRY